MKIFMSLHVKNVIFFVQCFIKLIIYKEFKSNLFIVKIHTDFLSNTGMCIS